MPMTFDHHPNAMGALALCLLFRLVNALIVRTAFAPDEYWQSVEVAHRMVFGYGHLTWEWAAGLRGYLHPSLFAALFWVLGALRLDSAWAVAKGPMLVQALSAAGTDVAVFKTAQLLFGQGPARWALACQLLSWFNFYCSVRTYSGCLEALLTSWAAYHWLYCTPPGSTSSGGGGAKAKAERGRQANAAVAASARRRHQRLWLLLAALAVVARPPCLLFWAALGAHQLAWLHPAAQRRQLVQDAACIGGCCLAVATLLDRINYGRWVVVPWEFLRFNLLAGGSALYGAHPWHWNLSQGFPAVAATLLPLMCGGMALSSAGGRRLGWLAGLSLAVYSLPAHKEFRFLLPALQLAMPYCGPALSWAFGGGRLAAAAAAAAAAASRSRGGRSSGGSSSCSGGWRAAAVAGALLAAAAQVLMALYFSLVQHRGLLEVPREVRRLWERAPNATTVLFLTQCHATPWYSHLHAPVPMRFLDCSPPGWVDAVARLNAREMSWLPLPSSPTCDAASGIPASNCGLSQQALFHVSPDAFLQGVLPSNATPPQLLVGYDEQLVELAGLLEQHGYRLYRRLRNCWWRTDDDTACSIALWLRGA